MARADKKSPHETIGYALKQAQQALRLHMDRELKEVGLTAPQYAVLSSLEAEAGLSNAMLARQAFVTPQTMQVMLVKLEKAGLIERTPDEVHGRIQRTTLTSAGSAALKKAHDVGRSSERLIVEVLGADRASEVKKLLNDVAERLR